MTPTLTAEQIEERVHELGEWFHNLDLQGVETAPHHFLGDYPAVKWRSFAHAIPADLHGKTVLDIGCNAGFYSIEMKRRGADRVVGIDFDEGYLRPGALRRRGPAAMDIEFRQISRLRRGEARGALRRRAVHGRALSPPPPACSRSTCSHEHAVQRSAGVPVLAARQHGRRLPGEATIRSRETGVFESSGYPKMYFVERSYAGDPDQLVDPEPRLRRGHAAQRRVRDPRSPRREVYICRQDPRPHSGGRNGDAPQMIEAVMLWNEPNNKSHWDFEIDPDWARFARNGRSSPPPPCAAESSAPAARARRHLADRPRASSRNMQRQGVLDARRRGRRARLPARLEPLARSDEWPEQAARRSQAVDRTAGVGLARSASPPSAPKRCRSSGSRARAELLHRARRPHPLVQPVRPAARLAGHHPPPRGRGLVLLPALLHGPAARGRHAQARARSFREFTPELGICQWFHFEDHRLDDAVRWLRRLGVKHLRTGLSWADSFRPDADAWFDRQMSALGIST